MFLASTAMWITGISALVLIFAILLVLNTAFLIKFARRKSRRKQILSILEKQDRNE